MGTRTWTVQRLRRFPPTTIGAILFLAALAALLAFRPPPAIEAQVSAPPADHHPDVYFIRDSRGIAPGRFGGIDDLVTLMGLRGLKWHRSATEGLTSGPAGLIARDSVVLIKVNAQWSRRGGTNTDVLRGVIRQIVEHPDGFVGEVVVADNGQSGGDLDRLENNAEDVQQSPRDVVADFAAEGWNVSTSLWDVLRNTSVGEYAAGDLANGYIVSPLPDSQTGVRVSYPKFRSAAGTCISYKHGVWSLETSTYDAQRLVVINMPVLKTHVIYAVTGSVKNHMGVVTGALSTGSHTSVGWGGMGSVMAEVRLPDLTILDCIWILARPGQGPGASYSSASWRNQLVASRDPIALDVWSVKNILMPQVIANGYGAGNYTNTQDPDNPSSTFRRYLDLSMSELLEAGIRCTNDYRAVSLHVWAGDADRDGDVDRLDFDGFPGCLTGPLALSGASCAVFDFNLDSAIDLRDIAGYQRSMTSGL
ncbi:MAG: DUF362 domain-containing protein [Planctomycetes bacterium]|nr:DUF362 domain-containing protein [Planctomycetota bacterium]